MDLLEPFSLPSSVPERKHGPGGYLEYQSYKDWLRDEFDFRCVYCLEREMWYPNRQAGFAVEHIRPQVSRPDLVCNYDNLAYACLRCNSLKQDVETLDPSRVALREHILFQPDGSVIPRTDEGVEFIRLFHLDEKPARDVRIAKLAILRLKSNFPGNSDVERLFREAFGYPDDLPDLRSKHPQSNSRPNGVNSCHFVRKQEGTLPEVY